MGITKNVAGQKQEQKKLVYRGQAARPTLYVGKAVGQGTYMSAAVNNELICDEHGKPMHLRSIQWDQN